MDNKDAKMKRMVNIYLYSRYERFWHWLQFFLITFLLVTGFEIEGGFSLFGFHKAAKIHNFFGLTWLVAFVFFIFWIFTTGEWKQYIPTTRKVLDVIKYYSYGIFKGEKHPIPKKKRAKHNPLQRIVYLIIAALLLPSQMLTGFLYWTYNSWNDWGLSFLSLKVIAFIHIANAFAILLFLIIHVYMTTMGHSFFAHIKAMITGWEEVESDFEIEDWEKQKRN